MEAEVMYEERNVNGIIHSYEKLIDSTVGLHENEIT